MPKVEVLVEVQGGCVQTVFVSTYEEIREEDVHVGIIDWDVFEVVNEDGNNEDEYQETVGWLAAHDDVRTMNEETQEAAKWIFENNPMTITQYREWEKKRKLEKESGN